MPARKRRATSPEPIPKRTRQDTPPTREIIEILDENESLESIVARIEEQERSEALAKQLSRQLNGEGGPSQPPHPGVATDDVIALDDEDDEALARRLAEEWAQEDEMLVDEPLPANDISDKGKVKETLRSTTRATVRTPISVQHSAGSNSEAGCGVESSLQTHKEVFVLTRPCTKCGKDVVSPRGYVRCFTSLLPFTNKALFLTGHIHASTPSPKSPCPSTRHMFLMQDQPLQRMFRPCPMLIELQRHSEDSFNRSWIFEHQRFFNILSCRDLLRRSPYHCVI